MWLRRDHWQPCSKAKSMWWKMIRSRMALSVFAVLLAGCGAQSTRYTIGGTASGLSGPGLVLANNGANTLTVSANGAFTFGTGLETGDAYSVTVQTHPDGLACTVANGTGTVNAAAVTNVLVTCTTAAPLTLSSINPASGASNVARTIAPALTFSAAVGSPVSAVLSLRSSVGAHSVNTTASGSTLTVTPTHSLLPLTTYTLTASSVRGANGEQQAGTVTTSFTTRDAMWQSLEQPLTSSPISAVTARFGMNVNGNAVAMWLQGDDSWTSYYAPATGWGPSERVQRDAPGTPRSIVMDANGNAIGVWEVVDSYHCSNEDGCERHTIRVRRYTTSGGWGGFTTIATVARGGYMSPRIKMNRDGTAILVWHETLDQHSRIMARRYTANGGWQNAEPISLDIGDAYNPDIALNERGDAIVTWDQRDLQGTTGNIYANRYINGSGWAGAVLVEHDSIGQSSAPYVVMNNQGDAVVVWPRFANMTNDWWWNHYTTAQGWDSAEPVGHGAVDIAGHGMDLAMDAAGNVMMVYSTFDNYLTPQNEAGMWATRYSANAAWSNVVSISSPGSMNPGNPLLVMDATGNALAAWTQNGSIPYDSWSNRYTVNGGWGTPTLLENISSGTVFVTGLEMDASGSALAMFEDLTGPNSRAFTKRFE